ncbi:MAG: GNAT family N-acetyltransferase [Myxococcales bacterium]|nr:GNAT family N-acetyltransferase [Myxococcales bacterium]
MEDVPVIRELTDGDFPALERFHRDCYGRPLDRALFSWLHRQAPTGPTLDLVADAPGAGIVGTYSLLPLRVRFRDQVVTASLAVGAAVHPAHRRRGVFTCLGREILSRAAAAGHTFTLGKPNAQALPGHRRAGFRVLSDLVVLRRAPPPPRAHACREVGAFDERLSEAWKRLSEGLSLAVARDAAWMNWRLERPGGSYHRLILADGQTLRGWLVLKRYDGTKGQIAHILDLWAEDAGALDELLAGAAGLSQGCREINLWVCERDVRRPALARRGFTPADRVRDWLIGFSHQGDAAFSGLDRGGWVFSYLDNDVH